MNHIISRFWKECSEHCPETRIEMAKQRQKHHVSLNDKRKTIEKPKRNMFTNDGRPYSLNEAKLDFKFDDLNDEFVLDLHVYR